MENKLVIFPKVVVYKSLLNDPDVILNTVKRTESYSEKTYLFSPWNEWHGNWYGSATQIDGSRDAKIEGGDEDAVAQRHFFKNVFEAFDIASKDFLSDYVNTDGWPKYIKSWDLSNDNIWKEAGISLLKYSRPTENQTHSDLAMNYHTDANSDDELSPGHKLAITVTQYLNDDYEGGEISFYDDSTGKVYNYKPKAGDVTVFPSSAPYYHGVMPFSGNSRYLLRMFVIYNSQGEPEWFSNKDLHGEDVWLKMEKDRLIAGHQEGTNLIHLEYNNEAEPHPRFKTFFIQEPPVEVI